MKVALVHDYLCGRGGSERVFQSLCQAFPEADIYTLAYNPRSTYEYFMTREIRTTWINPIVQSMNAFRWSFPISSFVMQALNLERYDVVLSSAATLANYVKAPEGRHLCYRYMPTRAIWMVDEYFGSSAKKMLFKSVLPLMRRRDYAAAQRVDRFIAISKASQMYIKRFYGRDSDIVYSPVELERFKPQKINRGDHFLMVSRLEKWKSVDYAIEAFSELGLKLRVVGSGSEKGRLLELAKSNITFVGELDDDQLAREYAEARALIFTPEIEYGLIPLEAAASGTPVICYASVGVKETMVPYVGPSQLPKATAIFYEEQTSGALKEALSLFEAVEFDSDELRSHASAWSVPEFQEKMRNAVLALAGA